MIDAQTVDLPRENDGGAVPQPSGKHFGVPVIKATHESRPDAYSFQATRAASVRNGSRKWHCLCWELL